MLEGELLVKDLPEAWHAAMQADLGIVPSDDRNCCLQDAHWYSGYIGGRFQSYTIGNILSAQFYAAALKAHPDVPAEIASGEFEDAALLAARQSLPARQQVQAKRSRSARNRRRNAHEAVSRLSLQEIRCALSAACE
jgi:hypothetical protein